jgi:hypothetical protein
MGNIAKIIGSGKTVFTVDDMAKLLEIADKNYVRLVLYRFKKTGLLSNPMYGIFVLPNYNIFELASKIVTRSYISFETVLQKEGIIFQDYQQSIMLAGRNTITKHIGDMSFVYHKLADNILMNPLGMINHENKYMIASAERAACDMIYLYKNIHFDNVRPLSSEKLELLREIYPKTTILLIDKLIKNVRSAAA